MKNPPHPGIVLRELELKPLGLEPGQAAERLGVHRATLSRVLNGNARIRAELAYRLELAGVGKARTWIAMQAAFGLAEVVRRGRPKVRKLIAPKR